MLKYCLDRYKTQDMCDKAVDTCLPALKFAPDWFATDVFSNDNIDLDNIDSDTATFFNGGVALLLWTLITIFTLMMVILMKMILLILFLLDVLLLVVILLVVKWVPLGIHTEISFSPLISAAPLNAALIRIVTIFYQ